MRERKKNQKLSDVYVDCVQDLNFWYYTLSISKDEEESFFILEYT